MLDNSILSAWKAVGLFSYCFEIVLLKMNRRNRRSSTSKEGSVTIIAFNGTFITMAMSPNKAEVINNCVARCEEDLNNREIMLTCMTIAAQAVTDAHIYKRTNDARQTWGGEQESTKGAKQQSAGIKRMDTTLEYMEALMEEQIKALSSIHLDIFRYSTTSQLIVDRIS